MVPMLVPGVARGADQTILGDQLVVKNPSTPDRRRVAIKAREIGSINTLVGNPMADGAVITLSTTGGTPATETYQMPAGTSTATGKPFWTGDVLKGFTYKDTKGLNGPVKSAQVKLSQGRFQIKVDVDGKLGTVAIVPPDPGSGGCAILTITGGDSYSMRFTDGHLTNVGLGSSR
jgi:hypothetical protein